MSKFALLIGINYRGTRSELNGCINDILCMKEYLINHRGYLTENITILTEDDKTHLPTGINIKQELITLIGHTDAAELWLHYSGHGSNTRDRDGDEDDGMDETVVPLDYQQNGMITDDQLHDYLEQLSEDGPKLYCIFDCCHSGTILDLKYQYQGGDTHTVENPGPKLKRNVIMISGCMDTQTSADAYIGDRYCGAMTAAYMDAIKDDVTCTNLLNNMRTYLAKNKYAQYPQMSSSSNINDTTKW
jgi:hypothetical protein